MEREIGSSINNSHQEIIGVREILNSLSGYSAGCHVVFIYPDIEVLRVIYSNYIKEQLDKNQMVLMLPYFETVASVENVLSRFRNRYDEKINVKDHLDQGSLLIIDSNEVFFNHQVKNNNTHISNHNNKGGLISLLRMILSHRNKIDKTGVTILADLGSFFNNGSEEYLLEYEKSIPHTFPDKKLKQVCLYHQRDFETRLDNTAKAKLLNEHGRTLLMMDNT